MRFFIAVLVGLIVGSTVNMALIKLNGTVVALPEGIDPTDPESLAANIHLLEPVHFLVVWLAHALGTFVGAFVACSIAAVNKARASWIIGGLFLVGGVMMAVMVDAPLWFDVVDLVGAYLPMAALAIRLRGGAGSTSEAAAH